MDYTRLTDIPNTLNYAGTFLNCETLELLKYSLIILHAENHFHKCFYWGRIDGLKADYHISFGHKKDCYYDEYYYSNDGITWFLLPKATQITKLLSPLAINHFSGDPSSVLIVNDEHFLLKLLNEIVLEELLPKLLKEEDRLAAIVELIKNEAYVVPRGGWVKSTDGRVTVNPTFQGLSFLEASDLKSYMHARPPVLTWDTNLLTRSDYNYSLDFLDTIDLDTPFGCWSLKFDLGNRLATLQSLHWLGSTFYHKLNTPEFGSIYIGSGKKNLGMPYML